MCHSLDRALMTLVRVIIIVGNEGVCVWGGESGAACQIVTKPFRSCSHCWEFQYWIICKEKSIRNYLP